MKHEKALEFANKCIADKELRQLYIYYTLSEAEKIYSMIDDVIESDNVIEKLIECKEVIKTGIDLVLKIHKIQYGETYED